MNWMATDEALKIIADRINSRDWWVFACLSHDALVFIQSIELRFYSGKNSAGFEAMMLSKSADEVLMAPVFFARKDLLSPEELAKAFDNPTVTPQVLSERDVIGLSAESMVFCLWLDKELVKRNLLKGA